MTAMGAVIYDVDAARRQLEVCALTGVPAAELAADVNDRLPSISGGDWAQQGRPWVCPSNCARRHYRFTC